MSHIAFEANLTADPEGGYGRESGKAYAKLSVAENHRVKAQDGAWSDGPTSFCRVTLFGRPAGEGPSRGHIAAAFGVWLESSLDCGRRPWGG